MNFSFELEGAAMTGNITSQMMNSMTGVFGFFFGGLTMMWMIICLIAMVFMIISRWRVFEKAGLPGRGILIPVYNLVLMFKLGGMSGRWAASILFPPLLVIMMIINYLNIAEKFGKHRAFGLGILLVRIVFIPILAFDNSKYLSQQAIAKSLAKPVTKPTTKAPAKKVAAKKTPVKK